VKDAMLDLAFHVALVLLLPPLLLGVINKTKAAFAGRVGPPLLQAYWDLVRLFRKDAVLSRTTTWIFRAGPVVAISTALGAALLVPLGGHAAPVAFSGDVILFAYLLGLGRFFTATAALDTGSAFEGMGAAREVSFSALAEPALFFGLLVLVRTSGALSLSLMMAAPWNTASTVAGAALVLVVVSWFLVLLAENSRIPFDDPNTHLELTMIHEVMVLDHSGKAFGLVLWGAAIKLFVFAALVANLLPFRSDDVALGWAAFVCSMLLVAGVVGVVESVMARFRLVRVPQLVVSASLLAALGLVLLVR